jgi:Cytotoxic translational repressor of toxin-antitoxin stability system
MYTLVVHRRAARYLKKLPQDQQTRIKHVLNEMRNDPFGLSDIKSMVGDWAGYQRVRVSNVRIIFWIDKDKKIVYVDHIGPRGDIYKGGA